MTMPIIVFRLGLRRRVARAALATLLTVLTAGACLGGAALHPVQAAPRPDAPEYAKRGPYPVGTREFKIEDAANAARPLVGTVWYPAIKAAGAKEEATYTAGFLTDTGRAIRDAAGEPKGGPYPLIIFSHGFMGLRLQSLWYTEHLASYGFVVIAVDHPGSTLFDYQKGTASDNWALRPLDVLREIAYAEKTLNATDGVLPGLIDMDKIAVTGHSLGGYTTLAAAGGRLDFDSLKAWCAANPAPALKPEAVCGANGLDPAVLARGRGIDPAPTGPWPATTDTRIRAAVALAPAFSPIFGKEGLASVTIPTMIIVGSKDQTTIPERDAYTAYDWVASKTKALGVLENGGHYIFVQSCPAIAIAFNLFWGCSDLVWDMDRAHDVINQMATPFFLETLKGDAKAAAAIQNGAINFVGVRYQRSG